MRLFLNIHFFMLLLITSFIVQASSEKQHQQPTIINITLEGSQAHAQAHNQTITDQKSLIQPIIPAYENILKNLPSLYNQTLQHKYKIVATIIAASYIHIQHTLHATHSFLQDPASWSNWKATASLPQLANTPQDELTSQLLSHVQKKYLLLSKTTAINSTMSPFDLFIKDIFYELESLQKYLTIQKYAKKLYLSKLFYFAYKKSFIQEKIDRIHFMIDVFINWQTKELLK